MATKTEKAAQQEFLAFIEDQLADLNGLHAKAMFGGYGLYQDHTFFGLISRSKLYFKTDAKTQTAYEQHGMPFFQPNAKQALKRYFEVPLSVLEDADTLTTWAKTAIQVASVG